jgi:hypothetical protein
MREQFVQRAAPALNIVGNVTTAQPFTLASPNVNPAVNPALLQPALLQVPGTGRFEQRKFRVIASGFANLGADASVTIQIVAGTNPTIGGAGNVILASTGAIALTLAGVGAPWAITLDMIFDSIAGKLCGTQSAQVGTTSVASAAIANQLTALNSANEPVFNMMCFATFSAANAASYATLSDFGIE